MGQLLVSTRLPLRLMRECGVLVWRQVLSSVAEMRKAIHDVLNSDEDMAGGWVGGQ